MTDIEYFAMNAINASRLKLAAKSLAHYWAYKQPATTDAMRKGTMFHAFILEPEEFEERYDVLPDIDRRTKAGKEVYNSFLEGGKELISKGDFKALEDMRKALNDHPAGRMFQGGGDNETVFTTKDPATGLPLKIKVDRYVIDGDTLTPIDIKTTTDASPHGFINACTKFGYAIQDAFYTKVLALSYPNLKVNPIRFVMMEKGSNDIAVYQLDEYTRTKVSKWVEDTLFNIANTTPEDCPPAYFKEGAPFGINTIDLPDWYLNKLEENGN